MSASLTYVPPHGENDGSKHTHALHLLTPSVSRSLGAPRTSFAKEGRAAARVATTGEPGHPVRVTLRGPICRWGNGGLEKPWNVSKALWPLAGDGVTSTKAVRRRADPVPPRHTALASERTQEGFGFNLRLRVPRPLALMQAAPRTAAHPCAHRPRPQALPMCPSHKSSVLLM